MTLTATSNGRAKVPHVPFGVTSQIEVISPELAAEWLEGNTGNRRLDNLTIDKYTHTMRTGGWKVNGEAIKFSQSGRLLDGQHRLLACQRSGVPLTAFVVRGLPDEVVATIDDGKKRTGANALTIAGYKNTHYLSTMIDTVYRYDHGMPAATALANQTRLDAITHYPELPDAVGIAARCTVTFKHFPAGMFAALCTLFADADKVKAQEFVDKFIDGTDLHEGDPVLALRKMALNFSIRARGYLNIYVWQAYIIKAWNAYSSGAQLRQLKLGSKETLYPAVNGRPRQPWHYLPEVAS